MIVVIFAFFQLNAVGSGFRFITCFRIAKICESTCDDTVFLMYSREFGFVKCRKIAAVDNSAFFYSFYRDNVSFRIYSLNTVEFFIADITEKNGNLHVIHSAGNFGRTKFHRKCIGVVLIFRMEVCIGVSVF